MKTTVCDGSILVYKYYCCYYNIIITYLFWSKLFWCWQVFAIIVPKMIVADNGNGLQMKQYLSVWGAQRELHVLLNNKSKINTIQRNIQNLQKDTALLPKKLNNALYLLVT